MLNQTISRELKRSRVNEQKEIEAHYKDRKLKTNYMYSIIFYTPHPFGKRCRSSQDPINVRCFVYRPVILLSLLTELYFTK